MNAELSAAWVAWIQENLAQGHSTDALSEALRQRGLPIAQAKRIVAETLARLNGARGSRPAESNGDFFKRSLRGGAGSDAESSGRVLFKRPELDPCEPWIELPGARSRVVFNLNQNAPQIVFLDHFLSNDECAALIECGQPRLEPSSVVLENGEIKPHVARTSRGAMLPRALTPVVAGVERRIAALCDWPVERGEGFQILRYEPGQEYLPHYDWFKDPRTGASESALRADALGSRVATWGQRVATLLLYLNDVPEGGATTFPRLGLSVQPKKGSVLYFANLTENGERDTRALHAGAPVKKGVKWVATKWLRERACRD